MRWVDHVLGSAHIGWILYNDGPAVAAILNPDHEDNKDHGPKWSVRIRIGTTVETLTFDPDLSLDEAKQVVQTLAGAQI